MVVGRGSASRAFNLHPFLSVSMFGTYTAVTTFGFGLCLPKLGRKDGHITVT